MLITKSDLPFAHIPQAGKIPTNTINHVKCYSGNYFYILYNGSILVLYKFDFDFKTIIQFIDSINFMCDLQIYSLCNAHNKKYWIAVTIPVHYTLHIPILKTHLYLFNTERKLKELNRHTYDNICRLNNMITSDHFELKTLPQCSFLNEFCLGSSKSRIKNADVESNLQIIKTASSRYATIHSVNNISRLPQHHKIFTHMDYLQCISISLIPEEQQQIIYQRTQNNLRFIKQSPQKHMQHARVHTVYDSAEGIANQMIEGMCFLNSSYIISSEGIEKLRHANADFIEKAEKEHLYFYSHTSSSRKQYQSFFPGNTSYSQHMTLCTLKFLKVNLLKLLEY